MEPWKSIRRGDVAGPIPASMGPRRWSRGRDGGPGSRGPSRPWLQWGHGDGAVEEVRARLSVGATALASMGPRRWSRGRARPTHSPLAPVSSFNGATAMEPWKRPAVIEELSVDSVLQWGHGDGAVEERHGRRSTEDWPIELQWGHGDGAVEEGPPPGPFGAMDLGPGLREGRSAGVSNRSRARATKSQSPKRNRAWAQREARARQFRTNIRIAKELWPDCGLITISAPLLSRVNQRQFRAVRMRKTVATTSSVGAVVSPSHESINTNGREGKAPSRFWSFDWRFWIVGHVEETGRNSPRPKWHEWPTAMGPVTGSGKRSRKIPRGRCPPSSPRLRR